MLSSQLHEAVETLGKPGYPELLDQIARSALDRQPDNPVAALFEAAGEDNQVRRVALDVTGCALKVMGVVEPAAPAHMTCDGLAIMAEAANYLSASAQPA